MVHVCGICGAEFTKKYNLVAHSKKAKYCLAMQEKKTRTRILLCKGCAYECSTVSELKVHENECVLFLQDELREERDKVKTLELQIVDLKLKVAEIEKDVYKEEYKIIRDRPTKVTNNNLTNKLSSINISTIEPFTIDTVRKKVQEGEYTYDLFLQGIEGVQKFILGIVIKDDEKNYATTDISRPNFHRLEESRRWVGDKGALFIAKAFDEMSPSALTHFNHFQEEMSRAIANKNADELERLDNIRENTRDSLTGIIRPESSQRKELLTEVIRYVKPYVAI